MNKKFHYKDIEMMHLLKKYIKKVSIIMYELTMHAKSYKKRENEGVARKTREKPSAIK
jgi:hypothetical protein